MSYETVKVKIQDTIVYIEIDRPLDNNTINSQLITDFDEILSNCEQLATVVVISGSPEVFCFGADFKALAATSAQTNGHLERPDPLYDIWLRLAAGPFVTVSHVRGKVNAGGVGFVAASDIVLADNTASFSLSELLFGLFPAMVLPFLIRRIGFQRAHYLTLMTQPISAERAYEWGLVDAIDVQSEALLRRHLLRLRRLSRPAIQSYKTYINSIHGSLADLKRPAIAANIEMFSDARNLNAIARFVEHGTFPWEAR